MREGASARTPTARIGEEVPQTSQLGFRHLCPSGAGDASGTHRDPVHRAATIARPGQAEDPGAYRGLRLRGRPACPTCSRWRRRATGLALGRGTWISAAAAASPIVSLERENALCVYGLTPDGTLSAEPLFIKNALARSRRQGQISRPDRGPDPCPSRWPLRLPDQSRLGHGGVSTARKSPMAAKTTSWCGRSIRPAASRRASRMPTAHGFELRTFTITRDGKVLIAASHDAHAGARRRQRHARQRRAFALSHRCGRQAEFRAQASTWTPVTGIQFWCGLLTMA